MAEFQESAVVCPCTDEKQFRQLDSFLYARTFLKTLHSVKSILNEEQCRSVGEAGDWWYDELGVILATKLPGVVEETLDVLEEYKRQWWCRIAAKRIKILSELYQERLVTEDEVERMKGDGRNLPDRVVIVQYTKPPEVATRTADVLDKFRYKVSARQLRGADSGSDMSYDSIGSHSSLTAPAVVYLQTQASTVDSGKDSILSQAVSEWKPRLHRRRKFKRQPSSPQTHTAGSESDSDSDSNKASSISSDDSHHSHGTPSPELVDLEGRAAPIELPSQHELGQEAVLIESPDEVVLQQLCYLATGIQQLLVGPDGGIFTLGSGDASLEFPPGAVEKETSVHYAIILHGPFVFLAGYKLSSVVIYINMDGATLVKPVLLYLSHWCSREEEDDEDSLKFATAPHTLQGGQQYYEFEEQEEADFSTHTNVGILKISEPQCLHCVKGKVAKSALYSATAFTQYIPSGDILLFRIQLMCDSRDWDETLTHALKQNKWEKTSSGNTVTRFEYASKKPIAASPPQLKGPGWTAEIEGNCKVEFNEVLLPKAKSKSEIEEAVSSGRSPPYILYKVLYTIPEEKRVKPALLTVALRGEHLELKFNCPIMEEMPQPHSTVSVSDTATSVTLPPLTPPAPDTIDIIEALNHQLDARWRLFSTFLRVDYQTMEAIKTGNGGNPADCMLDLLGKWTSNQAGTGTVPRTWQTVVEAVKETGFGTIAENLVLKHGVNLPSSPSASTSSSVGTCSYPVNEETGYQQLDGSRDAAAASQPPLTIPPVAMARLSSIPSPAETVPGPPSAAYPGPPQPAPVPATPRPTPFSVSEFLRKHETEFFSVIDARLSLLRLKRKGVITQDVETRMNAATNKEDAQEILYDHLTCNANVDALKEYCEVAIDADGFPNMQALGRKMKEELRQVHQCSIALRHQHEQRVHHLLTLETAVTAHPGEQTN